MKYKDRISEREHPDRSGGSPEKLPGINLQPLRSLETATRKRRAQKKKAAGTEPVESAQQTLRLSRPAEAT